MKGNRVDIYCRLSDEDRYKKDKDDDSESIANQKSMLLKHALKEGWEVVNIYSDDDWSGANINRPGFQKLLADCEQKKVDIVLCKSQSRFSRDMEVVERYIHNKFVEWGIRFVSIVDNADTNVEGNKKARQINGLINEWYLEDLSNNIKKSLQNKREDGLYLGSFAPYGYIKDPDNKNKLIIDPVAAKVVREIFELYKKGEGYYRIAMKLNEDNVLTPSNYKKENGSKYVCRTAKFKEKTKWGQDTIYKMLRNEVYIGNLVQGKKGYVSYKNHKSFVRPKSEWTKVENTHEAIIDIDTWNEVQRILNKHVKKSKSIGEIYMFSAKVYCKECGGVFTRQLYDTKDGKTPYMKCKSRKLASRDCINKQSIRCDVLEKIVLDEINKQLDIYYNESELEKSYLLEKKANGKANLNKIETLKSEKAAIEKNLSAKNENYTEIYEDKLSGLISKEDFITFREKISKDIETLKNRLEIINKELGSNKISEEKIEKNKKIFEKYKHIDTLTKDIVDEFVEIIRIGKVDEETKTRDIDIQLNIINLE